MHVCMYARQLSIIPENTLPDLNLKANLILTQLGGEPEARTVKELLPVSQAMVPCCATLPYAFLQASCPGA